MRVVLLDAYDRHPPADYNYSILFCLSTFEVGLSFVAACAPSLKPIVTKIMPKMFGVSSATHGPYSKGGTGKPSRLGYQLDQMTRRTEINRTQIEAEGLDEDDFAHVQAGKDGIVLTRETEVKWNSSVPGGKSGSSTESLV